MSHGPGPYDPEAVALHLSTRAKALVLIVIGGDRGNGFETISVDPDFYSRLPAMLRQCADEIEKGA
jgi:hypothetical protein